MKQFMKVLAVALLVSTVWMSPAHAVLDWYNCQVDMAGMPDTNIVFFRFTHLADTPAFANKGFSATTDNAKALFATALTAMSANLPVWIFADAGLALPTVQRFYLAK